MTTSIRTPNMSGGAVQERQRTHGGCVVRIAGNAAGTRRRCCQEMGTIGIAGDWWGTSPITQLCGLAGMRVFIRTVAFTFAHVTI